MNWKKWISIAAAVCLAVTAVPMRAVAQEEFVQEKMLEEIKEEIKEELKEEKEEQKEEKEELKEEKEELKEEKEEKEEKEKLQEQSDEKTEPQEESKKELPKGISLLMEEENSTVVSGNETADFEGAGTAESPYLIEDVDDLKLLAQKVNGGEAYAGKHFKLTADIDLEKEPWTPIGKLQGEEVRPFQGTFDGGGHQITNLKISNGGQYGGLFGYTEGAVIKSCNVTGEINGYNYTGGIVGYADANTKILNCSFQGNVKGKGEGRGGIVGYMSGGGEVNRCYVIGTVTGYREVGGIAGYGVGTIKNCYALADVTAAGDNAGYNAGGIAGYAYGVTIENCYYSGEVSAKWAGGIAGYVSKSISGSTEIKNCVSLAESVSGSDYVNRIAGKNEATLTNNYAWSDTKVNNATVSADGAGGVNGADLTYAGGTLSPQFSAIFGNDSAWEFTEDGLPILKNTGGTQSAYLPLYLTKASFYGKGTAENPYEIRNVNDLKLLAEKVNGNETANSGVTYEGKHFKLTADIDLKNEEWTPIGTMLVEEVRPFQGTFDGGGHQITNLKISNGGQYGGLFGYTEGAVIKSCNVTGEINGYNYTGGIVGYADANTKILNCSFQGNVKGKGEGRGGIVGYMSGGGEVNRCYVIGTVTGYREVGGIAGYGVGTIKNCYALADVTAAGDNAGYNAGGIAGYAYGVTIENCYYSGEVSASGSAGGIAGTAWGGTIQNCVSLAESVTGSNANRIAGGIFGANLITNNHSYNRTKLVVGGNTTYADGTDEKDGTNVFVSAGKLMTDVQKGEVFDWNGFDKDIWDIPTKAGKLPSLQKGTYPDLPNLPEEPVPTKKRSGGGSTATQTYTAQFDTNGGSAVDKVKTDKNGKIERPADPTKEGYIFVGWYSDSKLTKPFDFSAELTANSTLYAKWKENNEIILTIGSRKISVFGREIKNDVAPKIVNDRTMLPIRIVAESLGGTVTWNGELQRVTIQKGADVILITIGADTAYVNGTAVKLDAAAFVENGRTYLPLRFVSETLGAQVAWNEAEKTVTITK